MKRLITPLVFQLILLPTLLWAQSEPIRLIASPALQDSGILKFLLPRFGLKTGLSFDLEFADLNGVYPVLTDAVLAPDIGQMTGNVFAVMTGMNRIFYIATRDGATDDTPAAKNTRRFVDWLLSDIGRRTIGQFKLDGKQVFLPVEKSVAKVVATVFAGDVPNGETLSYKNCGRCHVIGEKNRMKGLGSTPSFAVMRTFTDWQRRFEGFFSLNPHPSFTQIPNVTETFDPARPPPIYPLIMTLKQLEDIVAYVATIPPADLGAPLVHQ